MKTYRPGESAYAARVRRRASESPSPKRRECLVLGDPTDCLLDAYECVAHRAYENFMNDGSHPGKAFEDWLKAERQILLNFPIDIHETDEFIYALASVPGATAAGTSIGIESQWMVILVRRPGERRAGSVCVMGLPATVDAARSVAVLADGVLGIRMVKRRP